MASVNNMTSRHPDSLLLNNLRPSAKHHQSYVLSRKIRVTVVVEHLPCQMEIDTGSEFTIGELVKVKGSYLVNVQYGNIHCTVTLIVANDHCLNWLRLNIFEHLDTYISELDKLTEQGVLEPVNHPVWSSLISTLVKPDERVRICGDEKCTVNNALRKPAYLITAVNQLLASLSKRKIFAKLYLAPAYQQLRVDDATVDVETIINHRGTFRIKRLQFDISAALEIFQNIIDKTVAGIQGELPYFDGNLIAASDDEEL
ncbi:Uncharacterized protein T10_10472 [Trichinella papuae]|uniref:Uncharacterized protein n=1 Tax=Trichinella papuae TaxID=268474 RepID=A0A0V1MXM9_9BILA|nr:Uncharacterized protein T10_10472 [Trichinella papuae]